MDIQRNRQLLIDALESGDYVKCRWNLKARCDFETKEKFYHNAHCFWGVACEVYMQENPEKCKWMGARGTQFVMTGDFWAHHVTVPPAVSEFFGLYEYESQLIDASDGDNLNFSQMAQMVRGIPIQETA